MQKERHEERGGMAHPASFPVEGTFTRAPTHIPAASEAGGHSCTHRVHLPREHPSNVSSSETPGSTALFLCLAKSFDAEIFIT